MTLALLPLGLVAIYQTTRVEEEASRNTEMALLALTGRAAKAEELVLERASGVVRFFASVAEDFIENPERCTEELGNFIENEDDFSFIGILPVSGLITCNSSGAVLDFSNAPDLAAKMLRQERTIVVSEHAPATGETVIALSEPFEVGGEFAGFVSLSIPQNRMQETTDELSELGLAELMTFNVAGDILTARDEVGIALQELPRNKILEDLSVLRGIAFSGENQRGERRIYTVVPIQGSPATVIGVWRVDAGLAIGVEEYIQPAVFPILMWFASMAVALLSIYTLVLRHITRLRKSMDMFSQNRTMAPVSSALIMPNELQALAANFAELTDGILREEAQFEDMLREKNVLIKEIHHRVKNNLQLISSIMNMHIRAARQDETKTVLLRLQDRVLSLATIHRDLYQSQHGGKVDVGALVSEIIEKTVEIGAALETTIDVQTEIDPVLLYPDQAVPLSLLVAEAMTNAMKHLGKSGGDKPYIHASLKQQGSRCVLALVNSIGDPESLESTGLGAKLIHAFSIQLGGQIVVEETDDVYRMTLHFSANEFEPEVRDF